MIFVRPSFEILTPIELLVAQLKIIEQAGRTCYKSEDRITEDSCWGFINMILNDKKHESVIEHSILTVKFIVDRGVTHELVRHRLCAFSQESTRYCNYTKDKFGNQMSYIIPPWVSDEQLTLMISMNELNFTKIDEAVKAWYVSLLESEQAYNMLSKQGWKPQQARAVLPNSLKSEIVVSANFREWRHIFKLRTSQAAHPQMREVMDPLLLRLQLILPVIFDNI